MHTEQEQPSEINAYCIVRNYLGEKTFEEILLELLRLHASEQDA